MEKQKKRYQFKSIQLWKDSIAIGFAIFGVLSAIIGVLGCSLANVSENIWIRISLMMFILIGIYLVAVFILWFKSKDSVTMKIRGIKVTVCQGDIFKQDGWKVIGVDDTFSISEDDAIISHSSLHGKLIKQLKEDQEEFKTFKDTIKKKKSKVLLGGVITYKDFILLALTHLNSVNEAHIDNLNYESIMRKMWIEIGTVYSGRPICLPILGDGITRFDGVAEKPSPYELLKCMLCTLKTSSVQLKAPITIVVYDRINEISLYNLKKFIS